MDAGDIIDLLGGNSVVATLLKVDRRVVANWRKRGFSEAGRFKIKALGQRKRVSLPEDILSKSFAPRRNGKASA